MGRAEDGSIDRYNTKDRVLLYRLRTSRSAHITDRDCVMATLFGMLFACHRSYVVATRALRFIEPSHPILLRGGYSSSYTLLLRDGDSLGANHIEVDAMEDLIVLNTGWQWPCRLISTAGLAWPVPHQFGAFDSRNSFYNSEALNGLLTLWGSRTLRALYVVVDPAHLREAEKPWPAPSDRWSVPTHPNADTILENYLASFDIETCSQIQFLFQRGNRRCFEVSAKQVSRFGGFGEVVELLESVRRRLTPTVSRGAPHTHEEMESETAPCRCRILTWQQVC
ncbi:hypothetical protein CORC01_04486 [Colletotrichum orchidophilum]|uniref:Uncharacterized protein n=1 Tax=Colletotrichum orchidophilum TaxID=1209926 RepID=A0A1G4BG52_9PEZI|nr:uncharacterized protein CORC01_04486 [Colletotrichum orchidophilum]OHF00297.1 hypothetical protein CORC01_04486 [Colletotrichum orchidophilum]